jgi:hypothetical protein
MAVKTSYCRSVEISEAEVRYKWLQVARRQWLMPVRATQEAEIRRIVV